VNLTQQFHFPDEHHACDHLTTLVKRHANRLLADEYWTDHHIAEMSGGIVSVITFRVVLYYL
jgi:hypothetical protein